MEIHLCIMAENPKWKDKKIQMNANLETNDDENVIMIQNITLFSEDWIFSCLNACCWEGELWSHFGGHG